MREQGEGNVGEDEQKLPQQQEVDDVHGGEEETDWRRGKRRKRRGMLIRNDTRGKEAKGGGQTETNNE